MKGRFCFFALSVDRSHEVYQYPREKFYFSKYVEMKYCALILFSPDCGREYKEEYQRQERDLSFHLHGNESILVDFDCGHVVSLM